MPITKTNRKKDGLQGYRVRVNYIDANGNYAQKEKTAYGKDEARLLEIELTQQVNAQPEKALTVGALYLEYCEIHGAEIKETSLYHFKQSMRLYVLPYVQNIKLDKLNSKNLTAWKKSVQDKHLSHATEKKAYGAFRALLNYAVKLRYISENPLTIIGNFKKPLEVKKEMEFYTAEEFKKYIDAAHACAEIAEFTGVLNEWDYYIFFMLAFYTGARKGEINALKWTDLSGSALSISRSIAQKLKGPDRETAPKNASSIRKIQLPQLLLGALALHRARWEQAAGFSDKFRICGGSTCLRDTTIDKHNRKYAKLAGLKHIRIHDFRHSHVSVLVNAGINIQEIARRLGHSDVKMTWNVYSHMYPNADEQAAAILNNL